MCGISGIVDTTKLIVPESLIRASTDLVSHRGPDDEGSFIQDNCALGHRRLAILDLRPEGHQPMHYLDRYTIVFNGEIYNYIELRAQLQEKGYEFKSKTDTEVIMAAYDFWQEECQNKFNGMWAFIIFDRKENKLFCSRDRFGVKPFYYYRKNQWFAFASEIKQFTCLPGWAFEINSDRLIEFITFGLFNHRDDVLFRNVFQLKGGHSMVYDLSSNEHQIRRWYAIEDKIQPTNLRFDEAVKKFKELFRDSVRLRLRADVKVGSCLSGGLDSSSIVGAVNSLLKSEKNEDIQNTVSSCFAEKKFDEQPFIDEVIAFTGVKSHKVFPDFQDLPKLLEKLSWHHDNPLGSASSFAQWHVFREAREHNLIVMLDGQGADEILAGYSSFFDANLIQLFKSRDWSTMRKEIDASRRLHGRSAKSSYLSVLKALLPDPLFQYLANFQNQNRFDWLKGTRRIVHPFFGTKSLESIEAYSLQQILFTSLPMLLHSEDRNSMAFSIESRVPFLDYRLVEFTLSLPPDFKINAARTKYIMREALKDYLPEKVKNRMDKMGFVTPEQTWITANRDLFESWLKESARNLPGLIDEEKLLSAFRREADAGITAGSSFWRVVSVNSWIKAFSGTSN